MSTNALALSDEEFLAQVDVPTDSNEAETTSEKEVNTVEETVAASEVETTAEPKGLETTDDAEFDYKAAYQKLRQPFKADGKTVEIRDDEEIVKLMQMGVNYSRKMQELNEGKKTITMLKNNGITEEQLSFLIDVNKKDPEAIKKLLKDSNIDPFDIDVTSEPEYVNNKNIISDAQVNFTAVMDDVSATDDGKTTLTMLHTDWDTKSKEALWENPSIMASIHEQRMSGVYKTISDEVDRQKMLGTIPNNTPFLQAYHAVGAFLMEQRTNTNANGNAVDKRVVVPKGAANGDRAAKAAPSNLGAKAAKAFTNPLAMSDEEFMKTL